MKLPGYYSSGEFAHKAHITKKTLRYYDEHNIFKPSYVTDKGARFYNDNDFAKLQQIQFFKYLGFSLFMLVFPENVLIIILSLCNKENTMKYDYLVVGSGLYGAIFAHEAKATQR